MGDTMQQRLTQDLTQFLANLPEDDRIKAMYCTHFVGR